MYWLNSLNIRHSVYWLNFNEACNVRLTRFLWHFPGPAFFLCRSRFLKPFELRLQTLLEVHACV